MVAQSAQTPWQNLLPADETHIFPRRLIAKYSLDSKQGVELLGKAKSADENTAWTWNLLILNGW
jgi:hypothetical protein